MPQLQGPAYSKAASTHVARKILTVDYGISSQCISSGVIGEDGACVGEWLRGSLKNIRNKIGPKSDNNKAFIECTEGLQIAGFDYEGFNEGYSPTKIKFPLLL